VPGARCVVFVSPAAVGAAERCDGGLLLGRRVVVVEAEEDRDEEVWCRRAGPEEEGRRKAQAAGRREKRSKLLGQSVAGPVNLLLAMMNCVV
jgi:hypothetical protein